MSDSIKRIVPSHPEGAQGWVFPLPSSASVSTSTDQRVSALIATTDELHASVIEMGEYVNQAEAKVARVEALHANVDGRCDSCIGSDEEAMDWPCPTIVALRGPEPSDETGIRLTDFEARLLR